jgi:hypothetical protein
MFGKRPDSVWQRNAAICLVVIAMGTVIAHVVDMMIFYKNFQRSAAFIESLRPNRPEGVGAEEWNENINTTVTAYCNVCTYDPSNDRSKKINSKILSLRKSPPDDSVGKLRKIWEILYYKCSLEQRIYLDRMRAIITKRTCTAGPALRGQHEEMTGEDRHFSRLPAPRTWRGTSSNILPSGGRMCRAEILPGDSNRIAINGLGLGPQSA